MYGRPPTGSLANRPGSRAGGTATWGRGGSTTGAVPPRTGVANAGPIAPQRAPAQARPGTSMRGGLQVKDRPMTQQGLGGLRSTAQGPGRLIQDKTYFQAELRQKITLLSNELNRINQETEQVTRENANVASFEKRADVLAEELRELQGQLGDFNTLIDKLHTDTDLDEIEGHYNRLKMQNQRESSMLDEIFSTRQLKENLLRENERQIEEERRRAEEQFKDLDQQKRTKYFELKEQNSNFVFEISKKQADLDTLQKNLHVLQFELKADPMKEKAFSLHEKLFELKSKKRELEDSLKSMEADGGPQEKARLLDQVKEDNQETSAMERKLVELEETRKKVKEELSNIEMEMDSNQGEKNAKYEELLKRDKEMQLFIDNFEDKKQIALEKNRATQKNIVNMLTKIKGLTRNENAPLASAENMRELESDLKFKEKEMKNSENTAEALQQERDRRLLELNKVEQLETKLNAELKLLKFKIDGINSDLKLVSNIENIRGEAEASKTKNLGELGSLKYQRDTLRQHVQALATLHEAKRAQLQENETYTQLGILEQKLRHHESSNFHLKEYVAIKTAESDYKSVAKNVNVLVDEINTQLQKLTSMMPSR